MNTWLRAVLIFLIACSISSLKAQSSATAYQSYHKGDFYFYWGWNRSWYTRSDLHLEGADYNFLLKDVRGTDRQSAITFDSYLNPGKLTTPQTNFRFGYFLNDHYNISFGFDHMKYVMVANQDVEISGRISNTGTQYDGDYVGERIELRPDFLQYEHTDGLNYINIELRRADQLFAIKNLSFNATVGLSAGALVPRTDAELLNFGENDYYHLSGFGLGVVAGLNLTFFNAFFIQSEFKAGYINMPSVRTTPSKVDMADQTFFFDQWNIVVGGIFHPYRWKANKKTAKLPSAN